MAVKITHDEDDHMDWSALFGDADFAGALHRAGDLKACKELAAAAEKDAQDARDHAATAMDAAQDAARHVEQAHGLVEQARELVEEQQRDIRTITVLTVAILTMTVFIAALTWLNFYG